MDLAAKAHVSSIIGNDIDEENKAPNDSDKLFFRVNKIKLHDLYDFAKSGSDHTRVIKTKTSTTHTRKPTGQLINHNKKEIALFRYGQDVFAIDEKCPHVGGPLHLGDIEAIGASNTLCVVCPWHRWKIELETGKLKYPQRKKQVNSYPVRVSENGDLSIGFDEFSSTYFEGTEEF